MKSRRVVSQSKMAPKPRNQTEASQPAELHLASGFQNSRMKSRGVVGQSKMAPKP